MNSVARHKTHTGHISGIRKESVPDNASAAISTQASRIPVAIVIPHVKIESGFIRRLVYHQAICSNTKPAVTHTAYDSCILHYFRFAGINQDKVIAGTLVFMKRHLHMRKNSEFSDGDSFISVLLKTVK
jgi:hypothetical protein